MDLKRIGVTNGDADDLDPQFLLDLPGKSFEVGIAEGARSEERRVGEEGRLWCDWSSDVCSSDLLKRIGVTNGDADDLDPQFLLDLPGKSFEVGIAEGS